MPQALFYAGLTGALIAGILDGVILIRNRPKWAELERLERTGNMIRASCGLVASLLVLIWATLRNDGSRGSATPHLLSFCILTSVVFVWAGWREQLYFHRQKVAWKFRIPGILGSAGVPAAAMGFVYPWLIAESIPKAVARGAQAGAICGILLCSAGIAVLCWRHAKAK